MVRRFHIAKSTDSMFRFTHCGLRLSYVASWRSIREIGRTLKVDERIPCTECVRHMVKKAIVGHN